MMRGRRLLDNGTKRIPPRKLTENAPTCTAKPYEILRFPHCFMLTAFSNWTFWRLVMEKESDRIPTQILRVDREK